MSTALKLGLLGICCAAGTAGVSLMSTSSGKEIKWRPLSEDKEYPGTEYKGKWGEKYSKYLLGTEILNSGEDSKIDNALAWEFQFNKFFNTKNKPKTGKFSSVNKASENTQTALNKVCDAAYKSNTVDVQKQKDNNKVDTKFKEEEVWKYCSFSGEKIKTIQESTEEDSYGAYSTGRIGEKYKAHLVSTNGNNWFWNLKQQEFIKLKNQSSITMDVFKQSSEVRSACKNIYDNEESAVVTNKKDIFTFCSLTGTEPENVSK